MKRDLKINFSIIEEIIRETRKYKSALKEMERAAANVIRVLEDNRAKSIEKLKKLYYGYIKELNKCYTELDDLDTILTSYTNEMQAIIKPIYPNRFVRVDRNDIYFNKGSIIAACQSIYLLAMNHGRNVLSYLSSFGKSEEEKYREEQNYRKLEEIWRDLFPRYGRKLNVHIEALNSIYKRKIIPFENKDDEFEARAGKLYYKYSNSWEIFRTDFKADIKVVGDLIGGAFNALWDLVKGIVVLAKGIISYAASAVVLAVKYPFNVKPRWANEIFNGTNTAIGTILKNPILIVEGISQQISDTFEEKGAAYCIGYAAGDFLGGKGLDKLAKVGKAKILSKSDIADNIGDAAKVIDKIDDTAKAADNIGGVVSKSDSIIGKIDEVDIPKIADEVIEGGSSLKSGINQLEPYAGVKQASEYLKSQNVHRKFRKKILESFDVKTIYMDTAGESTYGIRFHDFGVKAEPKGRYLFESFQPLSTRNGAALSWEWNEVTGIKQWKIEPGTTLIKGKSAPQFNFGSQYSGGVEQWYINNLNKLIEP